MSTRTTRQTDEPQGDRPPDFVDERYEREFQIDTLKPSRTNPRKHVDDAYLAGLTSSIRDKGVQQPIVVRPIEGNGHFEIVIGECRWRASQRAGRTTIPAFVRSLSDEQVLELQLVENIHRSDLTAMDEARGYRALITSNPTKHSAESIATRLGMSPAWVWDRLSLNNLIPEAQQLLDAKLIALGHGILLARLKPEDQERAIEVPSGQFSRESGLWRSEHGLFAGDDEADEDTADDRKNPLAKYAGYKPCSIREFERWIQNHVRFDAAHAAQAQPLVFEDVAAKVEEAEQRPGRGKKVISITHDYRVADDARADERTYGRESWALADGTGKSKTCDHSVLGVVVAGAGYGDTLTVCVARDRCRVHYADVVKQREKVAKLKAEGKPGQAKRSQKAADDREARAATQRVKDEQAWKAYRTALYAAVEQAVDAMPQTLSKPVFAWLLSALRLPKNTTTAGLPKALLERELEDEFTPYANAYEKPNFVKTATALGVDLKAVEQSAAGKPEAKPASASPSGSTQKRQNAKKGSKKR